jgi:hypothetical protein
MTDKKCMNCECEITHPDSLCSITVLSPNEIHYQCPRCALKAFKFSVENTDNFVKSMGGWESVEEHKKLGFIIPTCKEDYEHKVSLVNEYQKIVDEMEGN